MEQVKCERWEKFVRSDWTLRMVFGEERFRNASIIDMVNFIKRDILKTSSNGGENVSIAVIETLDVLSDGSGSKLRELWKHSLGQHSDFSNKSQAQSKEDMEREVRDNVLQILCDCRDVLNTTITRVAASSDEDDDAEMGPDEHGGGGDEGDLSKMSTVELTRRFVEAYIGSETAHLQGLMLMRSVFLIMLNVFARSKGIYANSRTGASTDPRVILKDMRDAFLFAAPVLWPPIRQWINNPLDARPAHFSLKNGRRNADAFFCNQVPLFLDKLLSVKITVSDHVQLFESHCPLDDMVNLLRAQLLGWVYDQHLDERMAAEINRHAFRPVLGTSNSIGSSKKK